MKKNFRIVLALVLALSMVLGMVPAMAAGDGGDNPPAPSTPTTGTITINSPIMGAKYFAYQIFQMTLNNRDDADAFGYFIDKDDPFYAAVKAYAEDKGTGGSTEPIKGLKLTGIPSTMISAAVEASEDPETHVITPAQPAEYELYAVTVDDRFDAQDFGQTMEKALKATGDDAINPIRYEPTYENTAAEGETPVYANVVTPGVAAAITFKNLPYGYYLITNDYDSFGKYPTVNLLKDDGTVAKAFAPADYIYEGSIVYKTKEVNGDTVLDLDETGNPIIVDVIVKGLEGTNSAAQALAAEVYDDVDAAGTQYKADHAGDPTVKTWEQIIEDDKNEPDDDKKESLKILKQYRDSYAQSAIDQVKSKIMKLLADDNAYDGVDGHKARLIFIDSTTPDGVINEKNEYEKWDVPVNPEGYVPGENTPNHDEPKGGKNIVVGQDGNGKTIYANSVEAYIGEKIHYQLSINAVNFERADKDDPKSVKQIQEYIIADYQNKNMEYVPAHYTTTGEGDDQTTTLDAETGLTVTIVKKDAQGNNEAVYAGPMDYSAWAAQPGRFFVNVGHTDLDSNDDNIFDTTGAKGGIVIPWVEKVRAQNDGETDAEYQRYITGLSNVYKNSVYKKADDDEGITAEAFANKTPAQKELYFLGDDGKYYEKIPVYAVARDPFNAANDPDFPNKPMLGQKYMLEYGDGTLYDWALYDDGEYYLVTNKGEGNQAKVQQIDKNGAKVWEVDDTVYFRSKYPNDVTILVDYWMELKDTAVIDGDGNKNISQFGVNYIEPYTTEYEFGVNPKPGETPPGENEETKPDHRKEQDDAVVYTYAIAIRKVDVVGNPLVGAKFKLRGVTTTEKTKGYYKVASYDHNAANAPASVWEQWNELETDDNGLLIVEGLPTKWEVEIMETEAPLGYNKLTETVNLKPFKTGAEVHTSSEVTYEIDENNNVTETVTSTETVYMNGNNQIAKKVQYGTQVTYYGDDNTTPLADDADLTVEGAKTAAQKYADLVDDYNDAKKVEITKDTPKIAEFAIVNNKGAELPSTGGIGTTIFYVGGSLMVLAAAILLITKRRMGAED